MPFACRFFLSVFFVMLNCFCFGQQGNQSGNAQNPLELFETHLKNSLISRYSKYPQEKVFVHTNQDYYSSGETIWYKVYALAYGKPSTISKVIYVRLADTTGKLIVQNMLPLKDGKAYGNIDISPKIKTGWYKLSAFTSWMMNFDQEAYYQQRIYISNFTDSASVHYSKDNIKKAYHITFYPEGGDLVDGNVSRIAFYASDENGLPANIEGVVKDDANKTSANLITTHDGMGEFAIKSSATHVYMATVRFPDGSQQSIKLPEVKTTGIVLHASQTPNTVHLNVAFSGPKEKFQNCFLATVQNSGQINTYPLQLSNGVNELDLPKSNFSTGILRLTIFDSENLPQAERILFINQHDLQITGLRADTLSFLPKTLNSLSAVIKDAAGLPVEGNFSIAVTDGDAFKSNSDQNIFSALLLSPELKGEVYDPGYYFENESDSLAQELDLVMLTNGWRHFSWQKILNNERYPVQHPVEQSIYVAGKVMNYENLAAVKKNPKVKLLIMGQDSSRFVGYLTVDSAGRFIIKDFNSTGISDIYMQVTDKKGHIQKLPIKIFTNLNDSLKNVKGSSFEDHAIPVLSKYYVSTIKKQEQNIRFANGIMLKTVEIKEKKITPTEKLISQHVSLKFTSDREFTLDLVNNPSLNIGLTEYMKGKFPGLQILGSDVSPIFIYRGGNTLQTLSSDNTSPYIFVNEAPVQGYSSISNMPLADIALIRFMPPPVWFAPYNGGNVGALMIYTKKNYDEVRYVTTLSDNFNHYIFNGFSITREFSAPNYSQEKQKKITPPDNRLTLYWNHDLNTDSNGALKFRFYNSDGAKKFKVVIQGMDTQGRLVYLRQILQP